MNVLWKLLEMIRSRGREATGRWILRATICSIMDPFSEDGRDSRRRRIPYVMLEGWVNAWLLPYCARYLDCIQGSESPLQSNIFQQIMYFVKLMTFCVRGWSCPVSKFSLNVLILLKFHSICPAQPWVCQHSVRWEKFRVWHSNQQQTEPQCFSTLLGQFQK